MNMNDPIADMLTRIRNAAMIGRREVLMPASKAKFSLAEILKREGYILNIEKKEDGIQKEMILELRFDEGNQPVIRGIERVSSPGQRIYAKKDKLPWVLGGFGVAVISTSNGLMTDREARKKKVGGEVICKIW
jgi:small subunit ribosomal protein S8